MLNTLPSDESSKFDKLKSMFTDLPDSILLDLSKKSCLVYTVDSPAFIHTYLHENILTSDHILCKTMEISGLLNYVGDQIYVLYQINLHSNCYLRGAFITDYDNIRAKVRDKNIDILLS